MRRILFSLGSSRLRVMLGMVLVLLLAMQILSTFEGNQLVISTPAVAEINPAGPLVMGDAARFEQLARTDHARLIELALERYHRRVKDYTCTLTKQERLGGQLTDAQVIDVRFKEDPFSVLMRWQVGATRGDVMLYVEDPAAQPGEWKMYIHPTGLPGRLIRSVERSPDDPEVVKSSLRSIREFGFARGMESLVRIYRTARANGHLIEESYLGTGRVDGRPTLVLRRVLPAGHDYPAKTTLIEIDQEYLVPVHIRGTDWQDRVLCDYVYSNIRFNAGLKDADFTREANGL